MVLCFIQDDRKIKKQKDIKPNGLKPIPIICHLPGPPKFSLVLSFNRECKISEVYL
jgi:hypothetical protein